MSDDADHDLAERVRTVREQDTNDFTPLSEV